MEYRYQLADVFTERLFGGNQLAVFLDAAGLTTEQMQAIAAELNLSETAFLGRPTGPDGSRPLRIFTPKVELPFAGHPTIGTAFAMAWAGLLHPDGAETSIVFQEGAGPIAVRVAWSDGAPKAATLTVDGPGEEGPAPHPDDIAAVLALRAEKIGIDGAAGPLEVGTFSLGVPFTFVPVRDRAALAQAQVDLPSWRERLAESWAPHLYLFTDDAEGAGVDFRARMFAPAMGIAEDPATGAAASTLAAYLASTAGIADGTTRWEIEQGIEMGRPSRLTIAAHVSGGALAAAEVGGTAVKVGDGRMHIPATT